jgi:hypothetical protein
MLLALATAVIAVSLGAVAALLAYRRMWALAPVRAFAVIAVAGSVALHMLPETIGAAGWPVLAACAVGFVLPPLVGRAVAVAAAGARHRRLAIELGYAGVLLHQVGDGLGLGAMTRAGHVDWAFLVGVVAHSVPLVAMITLTFAELGGARATWWRVLGLLIATSIGIALTGGEHVLTRTGGAWVNAAVAGLLFHILLHDADDREVPTWARPLEALGVLIGGVLPLVADHDHETTGLGAALPAALMSATTIVGVLVLIALALVRVLTGAGLREPITAKLTGPWVPLTIVVVAYALAGARAGDETVWTTGAVGLPVVIGLGAAAAVGAVVLVVIGRVGFIAWLGAGHSHDEPGLPAHGHHGPPDAPQHAQAHDRTRPAHDAHDHAHHDH